MRYLMSLFLLLFFTMPVHGQVFYLEGSNQTNAGGTFNISLMLDSNVDLGAIQLNVTFNPSALQLENLTFSVSNTIAEKNVNNELGYVKIGIISISGIRSGKIADLKFKAVKSGNATINISIEDLTDTKNNPLNGKSFNYTIYIALKGDFNGNGLVDIGDVAYVAYIVVGKLPYDENADFNNNGRVDIGDLAKIAYYLIGKINQL